MAARVVVWGQGVAHNALKLGVFGIAAGSGGVIPGVVFLNQYSSLCRISFIRIFGYSQPTPGAMGSPYGMCMCDCLHKRCPKACGGGGGAGDGWVEIGSDQAPCKPPPVPLAV